ncbi:MAG TPA: GNAT family N-acyltransferase [Terriglobales bacterium]|nr:GNAT family N-acyltransferase [Terriglobales bacterium]
MPILQPADARAEGLGVLGGAPFLAGMPPFASKLLPLKQAHQLYQRACSRTGGSILENLLREMEVDLQVEAVDLQRIPKTGPVVVVSNHPYGMLDGAVLGALLARVRPDVKVMTNFLLEGVPELQRCCIFVDPMGTSKSQERNRRALKASLDWLRQGGMLAVFPAGEVSHWQLPQGAVADPPWSDVAVRLIRKTGAAALPVYFCGQNSVGFQLVGMLHPRLRLAFLLQEFLQQQGREVALRIGGNIVADSIATIPEDRNATEYLRWRTYLLAERGKTYGRFPDAIRSVLPRTRDEAIASAIDQESLLGDLEGLPKQRCLAENGEFAVYTARGHEIPHLLHEVGRLREITFRATGEGTGKHTDLDAFDRYYWHLLLWHKEKQELVGAYRAANTQEVIAQHGVKGLYTNTLFQYQPRLFEKMGPALELGRSFVRVEYQRQYAPLLLLWKAIARFVQSRPETPVLFGAVSISNTYNRASRELICSFFETRMRQDELAGLVTPRRPFRPGRLRRWDCRAACNALRDVEELSKPISDVETDGKGLPILLKQYAKVGGKFVGFNVDRKFSDVLDGLVVVDLRETEPAVLERYMGREGLAAFRRYHNVDGLVSRRSPVVGDSNC